MKNTPFFWLIFYRIRKGGAWRAYAAGLQGPRDREVIAYRTKNDADPDFVQARVTYGKTNARLYKFRPEHYIFGGHK